MLSSKISTQEDKPAQYATKTETKLVEKNSHTWDARVKKFSSEEAK
jgi:hypothetical protein